MNFAPAARLSAYVLALCVGMALAPQAHAAAECQMNFRSGPSVIQDVRTIVMTSVSLQGLPLADAVAALKKKGLGEGWVLEVESNIHDTASVTTEKTFYDLHLLGFEQKAGTASVVPLQPSILVAEKTSSAILAVEVPKGTPEAPIRDYFCTFFNSAGLKGGATANAASAEMNFTTVNELMAMFHGDPSLFRKRGDALVAEARELAKKAGAKARAAAAGSPATGGDPADRGAPPPVADQRKVLAPSATFNLDAMDPTALFEGRSTIRGLTCGKVRLPGGSQVLPVANEKIMLHPYSPYLKEAIDLINDNLGKLDRVRLDLDPLAFADRIEGQTNAEGKFQFARLKPGRYLIVTYFSATVVTSRDTPNSMIDPAAGVIYHWWEHQDIESSGSDLLYAEVTIHKDGEVVDGVVVKPHGKLLPVFDGICKWHLN